MRLVVPLALVLAAAASRDGCGNGDRPAYDPCAGKACGEACTVCAPDDRDCAETAVVKACDPFGRCVPQVEDLCEPARAACAGEPCGADCVVEPPCRSAEPPCMVPSTAGHCDASGACVAVDPPPPGFCGPQPAPSWGCEGKACGDSCGYCPPGEDPANCPVPTFAPTACDAALRCVTLGTFTCPSGYDPCAGKATGACCTVCPPDASGCFETAVVKACDASGACVPAARCAP